MIPSAMGIWLVRPEALTLGRHLQARLGGELILPWEDPHTNQIDQFRARFHERARWVLVMATGIAVRFLDGLAQDKHRDPAVVVLDEGARHAIALLSGHEGGANALAYQVAAACSATPVVSTATEATKPLVAGIGCRKGASSAQIEAALHLALGDRSLADIREVATIDLKAEEPGLLEFCAKFALPLRVFAQADVAARAWISQPSAWVRQQIGVDGVCEPCALMASPRGRLLVPKTTLNGVAVALVADDFLEGLGK